MASFAQAMMLVMLLVAVFFKAQRQQNGESIFPKGRTFIQMSLNCSFLFVRHTNCSASLSYFLTKTWWNISISAIMQYLPFLKCNKIPTRLFNKSGHFCRFLLRDVFLYLTPASKTMQILPGLFTFVTAW